MTRMEIILLNFGLGSSITNLIYFVANLFSHQNTGTWRSGAHGWFAFLKPLPPGDHKLDYNIGVTGTGPNDHSSEISYDLKVK